MLRRCRHARADFYALTFTLLLACGVGSAQAADSSPAVTPPKPVVLQPTAVMAPPPPIPEATETTPRPAAKQGKKVSARSVKTVARQQAVKPTSKPKAKARKR